jgi:2-C-methyl-D-erythritol 4-phosphate cytidylyltransferase
VRALEDAPDLAGIVVGHPAYDTLKLVDAHAGITGTLDRSQVWVAQTPQVFRAAILRQAYASAKAEGISGTDDASLVERQGGAVAMLAGPRDNLKITVPEDLAVAELLLLARSEESSDG